MLKFLTSAFFALSIFTANSSFAEDLTWTPPSGSCDQIIVKGDVNICYSYKAKGAKYVWYSLDENTVNLKNIKKRPSFYPERSIPKIYRSNTKDYTRNKFHMDRGHLAPDADFDYSKKSLHNVYTMANIIPQYYRVNRDTWSKAERFERYVTHKLGKTRVINGVVYGDYSKHLKNGVTVPTAFWKKITGKGFERCFYYKNEPITKEEVKADHLKDHLVECGDAN